jgi:hypothetical protein
MATFHICEACRRAYKVFFEGARGAYLSLSNAGRLQQVHVQEHRQCVG